MIVVEAEVEKKEVATMVVKEEELMVVVEEEVVTTTMITMTEGEGMAAAEGWREGRVWNGENRAFM
ncbi:hypothetical protein KY290_033487 [Solanum tuberosum]|uniref:Uncharacterized protein n=1 Tax=Solanum tuberosum TaxID=4113 RepID=A0ABQ7U1J6_SOLTU|nr:hypothetical protein KY289_032842 [Solanum tuberosum]KAH0647486.1 hypothetical protein KY285_032734 [Solanum tuberosum]KAH0740444.1 hypothetical protein KY290_033487 [Solanum tuberosum]